MADVKGEERDGTWRKQENRLEKEEGARGAQKASGPG